MSVYPYNLTPEGAPTDATGSYPAVAGYTPMSTGRRVAIVLVDLVIGGAIGGLLGYIYTREESWSIPVGVAVSLIYALVTLWAMFFKSARVAGLLMKAQYVDVRTGRLKGGSFFLKQLMQGALAGVTFGIFPLIAWFASVKGPMRRNFFDRATKLMLVDGRSGRAPGSPLEGPASPAAVSNVAAVEFHPEQAPTAWGGASASPYEFPAVTPVTHDGGLITAVPGRTAPEPAGFGTPPPGTPAPGVPAAGASGQLGFFDPRPTPAPVMVDRQPAAVVDGDRTVLAPGSADSAPTGPTVILDDGPTLLLARPLVFGRNPVAPGSHPDAVAHPLEDALLSKTHLLLGRDETGVWAIDLNSTNGSSVAKVPGGQPRAVEAGRKVRLPQGASVHFGQHTITVG